MAKVSFDKLNIGDVLLVRIADNGERITGIVAEKEVIPNVGKLIRVRFGFEKITRIMYLEDYLERKAHEDLIVERVLGNVDDENEPLLIKGLDKEQYNDAFNTIKEEGGRVKPNDFGFMVLCDGKEVDDIIIVETPLGTEKIAFMSIMRAENGELMHDLNSGEYAYEEVFPRSVAEWNSILNYFNGQM